MFLLAKLPVIVVFDVVYHAYNYMIYDSVHYDCKFDLSAHEFG